MKSILIVDAGATKSEWIMVMPDGDRITVRTAGVNAVTTPREHMAETFCHAYSELPDSHSSLDIHYYGAGCADASCCDMVRTALRKVWQEACCVEVESDMLGAARALFGTAPGIACILGTGSNSCVYDGEKITGNIPSLGYILGDEGSGAALGKRLVGDVFKRQLPDEIARLFADYSGISAAELLHRVYRSSDANRYLASLVPFLKKNISRQPLYSIVLDEMRRFFSRNAGMYCDARHLPIGVIGSVGVEFEDIVRKAAADQGLVVSNVVKSPVDGLLSYHCAYSDESAYATSKHTATA